MRAKHHKTSKNRIRISRFAIMLVLVVIISIGATVLIYDFYQAGMVEYVKIYDLKINLDNYGGFDLATDVLTFGTIPPGSKAERKMKFYNNSTKPLRVSFDVKGKDINKWLVVSDDNFMLEPGELRYVTLDMYPPSETKLGRYEGKFIVYFLKKS